MIKPMVTMPKESFVILRFKLPPFINMKLNLKMN